MIHCHLWSKEQTAEKNEKKSMGDTIYPESKGENPEKSISQILQHQMLRMVQHHVF